MWGRSWSLEEVREVLGHSELSVTQRYAHLSHDAIAEAARATPGHRDVKPENLADAAATGSQTDPPSETLAEIPFDIMAPPAGIGPATFGLGNRCSIH